MEDGVKQGITNPEEAKSPRKAGCVKMLSGKFIRTYKDYYIQVENTEIAVYKKEDLQKCVKRLDLENYKMCHELNGCFRKKNRLVLVCSPNCGRKIRDVKLQTRTPEEKKAWIEALSDAMNGMTNTIFDEVKVDVSCSLDHVTRTRPKGNKNRRPPTRIHLKKVAKNSLDGILTIVLSDTEDALMVETHQAQTSLAPSPKPTEKSKEKPGGKESPQQKILKPPMPPSMDHKQRLRAEEGPGYNGSLSSEGDSKNHNFVAPQAPSKGLKPPMPPSKDKKSSQGAEEEEPSYSEDGSRNAEKMLSHEEQSSTSGDRSPVLPSIEEEEECSLRSIMTGMDGKAVSASAPGDKTQTSSSSPSETWWKEKGKCASMGDLLSETTAESRVQSPKNPPASSLGSVALELRSRVALELQKTEMRLSALVCREEDQAARGAEASDRLVDPSHAEMLAVIMDKLQKADEFLREVEDRTELESLDRNSKRTSW